MKSNFNSQTFADQSHIEILFFIKKKFKHMSSVHAL